MTARVLSVNVGSVEEVPGVQGKTAIRKRPVDEVEVRAPGPKKGGLGSGVVGDGIGQPRHHGGDTQAVYAVAREELDWWGEELGRELPDGMFGENLTTTGLDVDAALLGERWRVGTAVLEVCGPRIPCSRFAARMGEKGWVRRFSERGRVGAYLGVVEPGTVRSGDTVEVVHRPEHDWTVPRSFRAFMGEKDLARELLAADLFWPDDQAALERVVARQSRA